MDNVTVLDIETESPYYKVHIEINNDITLKYQGDINSDNLYGLMIKYKDAIFNMCYYYNYLENIKIFNTKLFKIDNLLDERYNKLVGLKIAEESIKEMIKKFSFIYEEDLI